MIDDKKIEEAATIASISDTEKGHVKNGYVVSALADHENGYREGYIEGAKWAINEFQMDLWHPMQEEPKLVGEEIIIDEFLEGKRYPMVQKYMVGVEFPPTIETIRWISNWDSFLAEICDEVKMIRWCYFKDLLPKEGGEQ